MRIHKNEHITPWDIDDTLIYSKKVMLLGELEQSAYVEDPLNASVKIKVYINLNNVRLLKEEFARGSEILVWSRGGYQWAANVIRALKLEEYVSDVYTKPFVYFDDKDISEWLNQRVWIAPEVRYKR